MVKTEFSFPSADGKTAIHAVSWLPERPPWAVVQVAHGVAEHILRYEPLAQYLTQRGVAVAGHDHLGHGASVAPGAPALYFGPRGSWDLVVQDLERRRRLCQEAWPGTPHVLLGHSMGSFLARTHLIRFPGSYKGAILMGTGFLSGAQVAAGKAVAAWEVRARGADQPSPLLNRLAFGGYNRSFSPARTEFDWLSCSRKNVDAYLADPLCGGIPTAGLFQELFRGIAFIQSPGNLARMDPSTPVLFLSGAEDPAGDFGRGVRRAERRFRRCGVSQVDCRLYPGMRHEILNESSSGQVLEDIYRWLCRHLKK